MKTVKKLNAKGEVDIRRVDDGTADRLVKGEGWHYCGKVEWKKVNWPGAPKEKAE